MTYKFEDFEQQLHHEAALNDWTVDVDVLDEDFPESLKSIFEKLLNEGVEEYIAKYIRDIGVEPNMEDMNCDTALYISEDVEGRYEYFLCLKLRCTTNGHLYADKSYNIGTIENELSYDFVTYIRDLFDSGTRSDDDLYDIRLRNLPEFIDGHQWFEVSLCKPLEHSVLNNTYLALMDKDGNIYEPLEEGADVVFYDGEFCEMNITLIDPIDDFEVSKWRYLNDEDFKDAE